MKDMSTKSQNVNTSAERVHESDKSIHEKTHTDHPMRHWDRACPACVAEQEADEWYEKALWGEKQEPVAWVRDLTSPQPHCVTSLKYLSIADTDAGVKYIPVYTAPTSKPWLSLTDEEIAEIVREAAKGSAINRDGSTSHRIARAIEAALRSKNNG